MTTTCLDIPRLDTPGPVRTDSPHLHTCRCMVTVFAGADLPRGILRDATVRTPLLAERWLTHAARWLAHHLDPVPEHFTNTHPYAWKEAPYDAGSEAAKQLLTWADEHDRETVLDPLADPAAGRLFTLTFDAGPVWHLTAERQYQPAPDGPSPTLTRWPRPNR